MELLEESAKAHIAGDTNVGHYLINILFSQPGTSAMNQFC